MTPASGKDKIYVSSGTLEKGVKTRKRLCQWIMWILEKTYIPVDAWRGWETGQPRRGYRTCKLLHQIGII